MPEHRREITEAERLAGFRRGEVIARDRNCQVGPQAKLLPVRVGGEKHAATDVLAGEVQERLGRLQDRWRHARIPGALVMGDERLRPRIGGGHLGALDGSVVLMARVQFARAFSTLTLRFRLRSAAGLNTPTLLQDYRVKAISWAPQLAVGFPPLPRRPPPCRDSWRPRPRSCR